MNQLRDGISYHTLFSQTLQDPDVREVIRIKSGFFWLKSVSESPKKHQNFKSETCTDQKTSAINLVRIANCAIKETSEFEECIPREQYIS